MENIEKARDKLLAEVSRLRQQVQTLETQLDSSISANLHRIVLENVPSAIFVTDDQGSFTYVCPNVSRIFGYTQPEVEEMGQITALLGNGDLDLQQLKTISEQHNLEQQITDKYGTQHTLLVSVRRVAAPNQGTLLYTCCDISERKKLEEELYRHRYQLENRVAERTEALVQANEKLAQEIAAQKQVERKLRQYQHIVNMTPDMISLVDRDYVYQLVNNAYTRTTLKSYDEIVGHAASKVLGERVFEEIIKEKLEHCLQGETIHYQDWFDLAGEGRRYMDVTYAPYRDETGDISGVLVNVRDVTDMKLVQETFSDQNRVFHALFERSTNPVLVIDPAGNYVDANEAGLAFLECDRAQLLSKTIFDYAAPDQAEEIAERHLPLWEMGGTIETEYWVNGRLKVLDLTITPVQLQGRQVVLGVGNDITDRKRAEEALRESEERYRTLIHASPAAIVVHRNNRCIFANPAAARLFGYTSPTEIINKLVFDLVTPRSRELVTQRAKRAAAGQSNPPAIVEIMREDGSMRLAEAISLPISYQGEAAILVMSQDVTARHAAETILRRREREARALVNAIPDSMFVLNRRGEYLAYKARPEDLHYREGENLIGLTVQETIPPQSAQLILDYIARALATEELQQFAYDLPTARGQRRWECRMVASGADQVTCIVRDITEQEEAKRALYESEEMFRQLAENIREVYWMRELESGRMLYVSPTYEEMWGQPAADLMARPESFLEVVYPNDLEQVKEAVENQKEGGDYFDEEYRIVSPDGDVRWIHARTFPVYDREGNLYRVAGVADDITERKEAETAVAEQRQLATALAETARVINQTLDFDEVLRHILLAIGQVVPHDGANIALVNEDTGTVHVAQYCECYLKNDLPIPNSEHGWSLSQASHLQRMIDTGEALLINDTHSYPTWIQSEETMQVRAYLGAPIRIEGQVMGLLNLNSMTPGFFRPQHAERLQAFAHQAAVAIRNARLHESVQQQLTQLREAQIRLLQSEKLAAIGELIAGVAHELNNPLTSLILYAQLLQRRQDRSEIESDAKQIIAQAHRATGIVRGLLDFARQHPPEQVPTRINDVIRSTVNLLAYELRTQNVAVHLHLADDLPSTMADPHQLQQVFVNLLNNARQAMQYQSDSWMRIMTTTKRSQFFGEQPDSPQMIRITVQDNGPGIPEEVQSRIFDPFFTTKGSGEGTGLGLSVCHGIINEHGGHIWVESKEGAGATFFIELPIDTAVSLSTRSLPVADPPAGPEKDHKILIIDDEESILRVLTRILQKYDVDQATNGEDALALLAANTYDLILCDVHMPGMSGVDLYREIQSRYPGLPTRILFMTGDTISTRTRAFLDQQQAQTLSKPFELSTLLNVVQNALNQ